MRRLASNWPLLLFALLPLLPLWRCLAFGETVGLFGHIAAMAPWSAAPPDRGWDVLQADSVLQTYVWKDLVLDAWSQGKVPYWNPFQLMGTPLLANGQSGALYPPHILLGAARVPTPIAINFLAWAHLCMAGLGTHVLTRKLGASETGAALSGAAFLLSAFCVSWLPLGSVLATVCWLPWALYHALSLQEGGSRRPGLLGLCAAMILLGGHLQFAAYGLMAIALAVVAQFPVPRAFFAGLASLVLGIGMAAPQLLPVSRHAAKGHRQSVVSSEGMQAYLASADGAIEATTLAFPHVAGLPGETSPAGTPAYWPLLAKRGANFAEGAIGLGPLVLGLLFGLRRHSFDRNRLAIVAIGAAGLLLAFGPLSALLYQFLPGWAASGSPGRGAVLFVLAGCVLAGAGCTELEQSKNPRIALAGLVAVSVVTLSLHAQVGRSAQAWLPGFDQALAVSTSSSLARALPGVGLSLLLAGVAIWCCTKGRQSPALAAGIASLLVLGVLVTVPTGHVPFKRGQADPNVREAFVNSDWSLFGPVPALMPPNTAAAERRYDLAGYDSLISRETYALIKAANHQDPAPPANGNMVFVKPSATASELAFLGVSKVWSATPLTGFGNPATQDGLMVYTLPGVRAFTPQGTAKIVEDGPDRQVVLAIGPGRLNVLDRSVGDIDVTIDGAAARADLETFRSVELTEGEHTVVFKYKPVRPVEWLVSLLSGIALLLAVFLPMLGSSRLKGTRYGVSWEQPSEERK